MSKLQTPAPATPPESLLILLIAAVQFINIVDFMMVMPLGPDFARDLGISTDLVGMIGASYTYSAAISAIIAAQLLDRFDRRKVLVFALLGLSISTSSAALADSSVELIASRLAAGFFGGPSTSVAMAILIDHIPENRRGRAMGFVMSAFSLATIAGVPLGLHFSLWLGWQAPFLLNGAGAIAVMCCCLWLLPPQTAHLLDKTPPLQLKTLANNRTMQLTFLVTACAMFSSFLLIPHLSAFFQFNLQFPRQDIAGLYMLGGAVSFFLLHITGRFIDRYSPTPAAALAAIIAVIILGGGYIAQLNWPVWLLFIGLMGSNAIRNISIQTLATQVPAASQRAGFLSAQSAVRHIASGTAAGLATALLSQGVEHNLLNIELVAGLAALTALPIPFLVYFLHQRLHSGDNSTKARAITLSSPDL